MSDKYTPTNFTDRAGTGLNKYLITGTPSNGATVELDPNPDTLTANGTPLVASTLNSMDDGIRSANNERKSYNLLTDNYALGEDESLWTTSNLTLTTDQDNAYVGNTALKGVDAGTSAKFSYDILSLLDTTRYYLISAYVKNSNLTSGINIELDTDDQDISSTYSTSTTYTRLGILIQPSDIDSATFANLTFNFDGSTSQFGFVDGIMVNELSKSEYELGSVAMLAKYPFVSSKGEESFDNVILLDENNVEDGTLGVTVEGLTLENSIENGDFSNGTTGWGSVYQSFGDSFTVTSNVLSAVDTANTTPNFIGGLQNTSLILNDRYFAYSSYEVTGTFTNVQLKYRDVTGGNNLSIDTNTDSVGEVYGFFTPTTNSTNAGLQYILTKSGGVTATLDIFGNYGVFVINVTALGIESYTKEQMRTLVRAGYFEGLQSTKAGLEIKSVGKNLYDREQDYTVFPATEYGLIPTGLTLKSTSTGQFRYIRRLVSLKPSTTYNIKADSVRVQGTSGGGILVQDESATTTLGGNVATLNPDFNFTVPADGLVLISFVATWATTEDGEVVYTNLQLEQGSTSSAYEDYKESIVRTNETLRRVPIGTKDEQNMNTGVITKRIQEYTFEAGDFTALTTGTNVDKVRTDASFFSDITSLDNAVQGVTLVDGFANEVDAVSWDTAGNENSHDATSTGRIELIFASGTYADLATAQTALAGTKIIYQLSVPETINNAPQVMQGFQKGQITKSVGADNSTGGKLVYLPCKSTKDQITGNTDGVRAVYERTRILYSVGETESDTPEVSIPLPEDATIVQIEFDDLFLSVTNRILQSTFNNDTGNNYSNSFLSATAQGGAQNDDSILYTSSNLINDTISASGTITIYNNPSSKKVLTCHGTANFSWVTIGGWYNQTDKINSIQFGPNGVGNIVAGFKYKVYYYKG